MRAPFLLVSAQIFPQTSISLSNETDISPWIFIRYSEQLWQLEEADQPFKKEVSNYKRVSYRYTRFKRHSP